MEWTHSSLVVFLQHRESSQSQAQMSCVTPHFKCFHPKEIKGTEHGVSVIFNIYNTSSH